MVKDPAIKPIAQSAVARPKIVLLRWPRLSVLCMMCSLLCSVIASELRYDPFLTAETSTVEAALHFIQLMRPDDRINALHHEPFSFLESSAIAKA
jgi:hypothetical protein